MEITYRFARDTDAAGLIALIDKCYAGYEGCILDVDQEEPQLRHIASHYAKKNGKFWVAEQGGRIVGSIGYTPTEDGVEIKHLYVDGDIRRRGLATHLCDLAEDAVRQKEVQKITLWTDTRFVEAHRLYERRGFIGGQVTRDLQDLSNTSEYYYEKALRSS